MEEGTHWVFLIHILTAFEQLQGKNKGITVKLNENKINISHAKIEIDLVC